MALTDAEETELAALEIEFEAAGGRGIEIADRLDFLRAKESYMTVTEFIAELSQTTNPDKTFVVIDDNEVDYPMEFISCAGILGHS